MIRVHARTSLALAMLCAAPAVGARGFVFDTALVRTTTIGQLLDAARVGDSLGRIASWNPALHARVRAFLAQLDRPETRRMQLDVIANPRASAGVVAKHRRPTAMTANDVEALDTLANVMERVYRTVLRDSAGLSPDSIGRLMSPRTAWVFARRQRSIAHSVDKLMRFERKYGPGSPKLNGVEVLLNHGAQWIPFFQPDAEGWPSRFELVAAYVPTYLTVVDGDARAVTIAEVGLRSYVWRNGWGGRSGGVLRPGYWSFGAALAGGSDGAMTSPFQGDMRPGVFIGYGDAKVAWISGPNSRFLVTRQVQLVPWTF